MIVERLYRSTTILKNSKEQASFKTSLNDEEIKPLATGGIVWVNSINGNLNTRNIEITTKYVSYVGSKPDSLSFTNKFLASDVQTVTKDTTQRKEEIQNT